MEQLFIVEKKETSLRMYVLFYMSIFRLQTRLGLSFEQVVLTKLFFQMHVSVWKLQLRYVRWTKVFHLVEPLVKRTRIWNTFFVTPTYSD